MPKASALVDLEVFDRKNKSIGTLTHVLFDAEDSRAIGFEMRPRLVGYVVERKPQYFALDAVELSKESIRVTGDKPSGAAAAKRLGVDWDETVIWDFQNVCTQDGTLMGQVREVAFTATGEITRIEVSGGMSADVAIGRHTIDAADILGFDGTCVRVRNAADNEVMDGGMAAQAGKGAAVAKHVAGQAAGGAVKVGVKAVRGAAKSDTGKAVAKGWKSFADSFKEGLKGDDE